jgi:hypothetical protein
MTDPSYYFKGEGGWFVTKTLEGCHPLHTHYPLLEGDWINKREDGTWGKIAPGLGIEGFVLTEDQEATLRQNTSKLTLAMGGMEYSWSNYESLS